MTEPRVRSVQILSSPNADDLLALPFFEGPVAGPGIADAERGLGISLEDALRRAGFRGRRGEFTRLLVPNGGSTRQVAAVGIGPQTLGITGVRDAAQRLGVISRDIDSVVTTLGDVGSDDCESLRATVEGFLLGAYRPPRLASPLDGQRRPQRLALLHADPSPAEEDAVASGVAVGECVNWARDLVHRPAALATPEHVAEECAELARAHGATATVLSASELEAQGFGGVLGVGRGSRNRPCLVELVHHGADEPPVALIGKGVTFDAGGLNLKTDPKEIEWMRADMAGGAAVAAAVIAAARLSLPVHVVAVIPLAENMPDGNAIRPGDVLTHRGGKTTEIIDTDCEGRLLVADGLAYLSEREPAALIDVATLTDAGGVGYALWAAMGTDRALLRELLDAGGRAGDPGWTLPLPDTYPELFRSDVADVRNTAVDWPDTAVMAATYLREFAGTVPWAHIDNGSTAWYEHAAGAWPEGATGSPARALVRFLEKRAVSETS